MTQITKHDALLALDAAMAALASARVMVEAIGEDPSGGATGECQHLRQSETFAETLCRDCGATLAALGVPQEGADTPTGSIPSEVS